MINNLSKIEKKNMLIIAHKCSTEKRCFEELKKYWCGSNLIESTETEYKENMKKIEKNLSSKCFYSGIKPPNNICKNYFSIFDSSIVFVDSIDLIKFETEKTKTTTKKSKPKPNYSLEGLYKKYLDANYKEKHRALPDSIDLFNLLKKIFEKKNFFNILTEFLKQGQGIYFFDEKLNEKK
jgi:hypothetical protein